MINKLFLITLIAFSLNGYAQQTNWLNYISTGHINTILAVDNEVFFGGVSSGLIRYDVDTDTKTYYNKANSGIGSNVVKSIAADDDGNIWVGSSYFTGSLFSGGLYHFDGTSWEILTIENSLNPFMSLFLRFLSGN